MTRSAIIQAQNGFSKFAPIAETTAGLANMLSDGLIAAAYGRRGVMG